MLLSGEILFPVCTTDEREAERQLTQFATRCGQDVAVLAHRCRRWPKDHLKVTEVVVERLTSAGANVAHTHAAQGNWADCILRYAHELDPKLIFMPAGEEARHDDRRMSAHALAVARHASHSVWVAKPHTPPVPDTVICAVDGGRASAEALRMAIELSRGFGARLVTAHALREPAHNDVLALAMGEAEHDEARESSRSHLEGQHQAFLDDFRYEGLTSAPEHRLLWSDRASDALLAVAADHPNALIVLGSAGTHRFFRSMLGSTSTRVLERTPCSLLLVRY